MTVSIPRANEAWSPQGAATASHVTLLDLRDRLWDLLTRLAAAPGPADAARIPALAREVEALCRATPDVVLCSLLLDESSGYAEIHPLMVAMVCTLLAPRAGLDADTRQAVVAAALTCNLGMLALHEQAAARPGALSATEQRLAREHPLRSVALLRAAGVEDPLWLDVVAQHHERPDGSGYPFGLRGARLSRAARLVALADLYAAMVLPREYRDGIRAQEALREIFLQRGGAIDAALAGEFINVLGVFPPGVFVRLDNGEIGVVIARGHPRASDPVVSSFRSPHGHDYPRPLRRDTATLAPFQIAEVLRRQALPFPIPELWATA